MINSETDFSQREGGGNIHGQKNASRVNEIHNAAGQWRTSRISYFQLLLYTDTNSLFNPSGNIKTRGVFSRFSARLEAGQRGATEAAAASLSTRCAEQKTETVAH